MEEKVLEYALNELKKAIEKIEHKTEIQAIDIAAIKTDIQNIKEDIARLVSNGKKNGQTKQEFYLSITALASAIVALAMTLLKVK